LNSDSISIRTCFLNLLLEFIRTTYPGNLYPIGLPESRPNNLPEQLARAPPERLTLSHQCLPDLICSYPAELPYMILLPIRLLPTPPNYLIRFFFQSDFYLFGLTWSYPTELPYLIFLLIALLPTQSYLATLPDFLTRPGNTSLHPTSYPALPNHLTWSGTLQLASPKNFLISLPP
jgi:hypothetical protein